jgi:hypothetical protein
MNSASALFTLSNESAILIRIKRLAAFHVIEQRVFGGAHLGFGGLDLFHVIQSFHLCIIFAIVICQSRAFIGSGVKRMFKNDSFSCWNTIWFLS